MEYYLSLLTFTFVAGITPGPNNLMLVVSGLNHGIRKSLPHYFGICIGFPLMVAVIGFGLGALFLKFPGMYLSIKVLGISYLLFLAWKIANAGNIQAKKALREPLTFLQGAAFQWVNPKAWVIAIGALAAFTIQGNVTESVMAIILVYLIMGFVCMGLWLKLGQVLQQFLSGESRIRMFNILMAALLVLSVIPMVLSEINL
jgi:threonine/homoserine/homoserine lactone efflux protein